MIERSGRPVGGRRHLLLIGTTALFALLIGRLWFLQVVSASEFDEQAAGNRSRLVYTEGPRGRILDAKGVVIADRRRALDLAIDWEVLSDLGPDRRSEIFEQLRIELSVADQELSVDELRQHYERAVGRSLKPEVVLSDIGPDVWVAISERNLPGVEITESWRRSYPNGATAGHLLGHLGTVTDRDEARILNRADAVETKPYEPGQIIGRNGLEARFESALRGNPEIRRVEIDANNRIVRTTEVLQEANPGLDLYLTIDLDVQADAERIVDAELTRARGKSPSPAAGCDECTTFAAPAGALVALRPNDGSIVALVSHPGFDPSWFVDGLSEGQAAELFQSPEQPLFNRAIAGRYPMGSTFKPVTAFAALTTGARSEADIWVDQGQYRLAGCQASGGGGCVFQNAGGVVMGPVDLRAALARSSDTYFYSLGEMFWAERDRFGDTVLQDAATRFGFGLATGVDLPGESAGIVPTPGRAEGDTWFTGDSVNLAIGQGQLLATPLQLANLYAELSGDEPRQQPRVAVKLVDSRSGEVAQRFEPVAVGASDLDTPAEVDALRAISGGLHDATRSGTASRAFAGFPFEQVSVAGKTGTAEVDGRDDFSLFAGYGYDATSGDRLVVAVVLEEAGFGGNAAAPTARAFFETAFGLDPLIAEESGPVGLPVPDSAPAPAPSPVSELELAE